MTWKIAMSILVLGGCFWQPVDTRRQLDEFINDEITVPRDGSATLAIVTRWRSTRGRQRITVAVNFSNDEGIRTTLSLRVPGAGTIGDEAVDKDLSVSETLECSHRECDLEVPGTITFEDLGSYPSTDRSGRVVSWALRFAVAPQDRNMDLTDMTFEVVEPDGGTP